MKALPLKSGIRQGYSHTIFLKTVLEIVVTAIVNRKKEIENKIKLPLFICKSLYLDNPKDSKNSHLY